MSSFKSSNNAFNTPWRRRVQGFRLLGKPLAKDGCFSITADAFRLLCPFLVSFKPAVSGFILIFLLWGVNQVAVAFFHQRALVLQAMTDGDASACYAQIRLLCLTGPAVSLIYTFVNYVQTALGFEWRRYLTKQLIAEYFSLDMYYHLALKGGHVDNPDQRIAQDAANIVRKITWLLFGGHGWMDGVLTIIAFGGALYAIAPDIMAACIIYSIFLVCVVVLAFFRKLANLARAVLAREADFRYGLMRVREHAEAIALLCGSSFEKRRIDKAFQDILTALYRQLHWDVLFAMFYELLDGMMQPIPYLLLGSRVFAGTLKLQDVEEGTSAFGNVAYAVTIVVTNKTGNGSNFKELTDLAAETQRITTLKDALAEGGTCKHPDIRKQNSVMDLRHVNVVSPSGSVLLRDLSLEMDTGQRLLITGPSGCGKSSLLRVLAGLWPAEGTVAVTPSTLFLPQVPYIFEGSLREQLMYPSALVQRNGQLHIAGFSEKMALPDSDLTRILREVHLHDLLSRWSLDAVEDWPRILSAGEQQRLQAARALVQDPDLLLVDEATSAMDLVAEAAVYKAFCAKPSRAVMSVAHRATIRCYHSKELALSLMEVASSLEQVAASWKLLDLEHEEIYFPRVSAASNLGQLVHDTAQQEIRISCSEALFAVLHTGRDYSIPFLCSGWKPVATIVGILALTIFRSTFYAGMTRMNANMLTTLSKDDEAGFYAAVHEYFFACVASVAFTGMSLYIQKTFAFQWRCFITKRLVSSYFTAGNYYQLSLMSASGVDNPDQRIGQDVANFVPGFVSLVSSVVSAGIQIVTYFGLMLETCPKRLVGILLIYVPLLTALSLGVFYRPLARLSQVLLKREADLRRILVRTREYAESIGMLCGGSAEQGRAEGFLGSVLEASYSQLRWQTCKAIVVDTLTSFEGLTVLVYLNLAPLILRGEFAIGTLSLATSAFSRVTFALLLIVSDVDLLTQLSASAARLASLKSALGSDPTKSSELEESVAGQVGQVVGSRFLKHQKKEPFDESLVLELKALEVKSPVGTALIQGLCLQVEIGQRLLITGPSGCGKSSLFRIIGGLWPAHGTCAVVSSALILPQAPYVFTGSLREQLLYPCLPAGSDEHVISPLAQVTDTDLARILREVHLHDLLGRWSLDTVEDWQRILSTGEQQRLQAARALVQDPALLLLDEATSAMDLAAEAAVYSALSAKPSRAIISVAHRTTVRRYHTKELAIEPGHEVEIKTLRTGFWTGTLF